MNQINNPTEIHNRVIIHIDIDCFYAQVEELRDPSLKTKPMGIQQKNCLATANYVARKLGVKKLMSVTEAKKLCPQMVLVNGEDLSEYKAISGKIFDVLTRMTGNVEKLGLDENFVDVTQLVDRFLVTGDYRDIKPLPGCVYPTPDALNSCGCGCDRRLTVGAKFASDMRRQLIDELGLTSSAGIAHNKLLAKVIGGRNKPDNQTVMAPLHATEMMSGLGSIRKIPGIGEKLEAILNRIDIRTITDLQDANLNRLQKVVPVDQAKKLLELSVGIDPTPVKPSVKPKIISVEDSCPISLRQDVEEKFRALLARLIHQISNDSRIPKIIKIVLRKSESNQTGSHREIKQATVPTVFTVTPNGKLEMMASGEQKILQIIMKLFEKSVDLKRSFQITLLGLAFSNFEERQRGDKSIAQYLIKNHDVQVQSKINLNNDGLRGEPDGDSKPIKKPEVIQSKVLPDVELEPTTKKPKTGNRIDRFFTPKIVPTENNHPIQQKLSDLHLNNNNGHSPTSSTSTSSTQSSSRWFPDTVSMTFATVDRTVFYELPVTVQKELLYQWSNGGTADKKAMPNGSKDSNQLHRYFFPTD